MNTNTPLQPTHRSHTTVMIALGLIILIIAGVVYAQYRTSDTVPMIQDSNETMVQYDDTSNTMMDKGGSVTNEEVEGSMMEADTPTAGAMMEADIRTDERGVMMQVEENN